MEITTGNIIQFPSAGNKGTNKAVRTYVGVSPFRRSNTPRPTHLSTRSSTKKKMNPIAETFAKFVK